MRFLLFTLLAILSFPVTSVAQNTWYVPDNYATIQGAINGSADGDTIIVRPGTYVENINFLNRKIVLKSEFGPEATVIDGNKSGPVVTFETPEAGDSKLDGFTITNGFKKVTIVDDGGGGIFCKHSSPLIINNIITRNWVKNINKIGGGGGIYCFGCAPTLINNIIKGNTVSGPSINWPLTFGGGMCNKNSSPVLTDCVFYDNTSSDSGGGMANDSSSPVLTNCRFIRNTTTNPSSWEGGGMYNVSSKPKLTGCDFMWNIATLNGGGMANCQSSPVLTDCVFSNNSITNSYGFGGGMYNENSSSPIIKGCVFLSNAASYGGGGLHFSKGSPKITRSLFLWNSADLGGGMYNTNSSAPGVINCIFHGNSATGSGGGIYNNECSLKIANCTLSGNLAKKSGGGVYSRNNASVGVSHCILWGDNGDEIYLDGASCSVTYSCVQGGYPGSGNIQTDPLFTAGPKGFFYLSQVAAGQTIDSPCVDSGGDLANNLGMGLLWTRTDGVPDGGVADMGFHYGDFRYPWLQTKSSHLSASVGGAVDFVLFGDTVNANRNYLLFGSVSGVFPGTPLPGGHVILPLNWDLVTNLMLVLSNTPYFQNFYGTLNPSAEAAAGFDTLGPVPGVAGLSMNFAFALNNPWNFVSNPVQIQIIP